MEEVEESTCLSVIGGGDDTLMSMDGRGVLLSEWDEEDRKEKWIANCSSSSTTVSRTASRHYILPAVNRIKSTFLQD